jgi:hypothetical protein
MPEFKDFNHPCFDDTKLVEGDVVQYECLAGTIIGYVVQTYVEHWPDSEYASGGMVEKAVIRFRNTMPDAMVRHSGTAFVNHPDALRRWKFKILHHTLNEDYLEAFLPREEQQKLQAKRRKNAA